MDQHTGQLIGYAIGGVLILAVLAFRMNRMMTSTPFRLEFAWIAPAFFLVMTSLLLWQTRPQGTEWIWLVVTFIVGAGLGWLRGKTVSLALDPATGQVMAQASRAGILFLFGLIAVRFGMRFALQSEAHDIGVRLIMVDVLFLTMALGLFLARAVEMGLRAFKLKQATPAVA